jgi:transposase-like protein
MLATFGTTLLSEIATNSKELERDRQYWIDLAFYLSVGEQAPFSSVEEVMNLPISTVLYMTKKLNDLYERQAREQKKQSRK